MPVISKISPCLWFDNQAEEAANFYVGIFKKSKIVAISRFGEAGYEIHHRPAGSVMTVVFEIGGQSFTALNGGPLFKFNEAVSFQVFCETQGEIDFYWEKLSAGGDPNAQQCGWLKDKYGLSWQIVPSMIGDWYKDHTSASSQRVMEAMLEMRKLDIDELQRAYAG